MANIFINGLNAKAGGGKSILNNYLTLLKASTTAHNYFILVPNTKEYKKYQANHIKIISLSSIYNVNFAYPYTYSFLLGNLLKNIKIDLVFNLADIPIKTKIKQVFLFDWPYAAYPQSPAWSMMDLKSQLIRKVKLFYFKRYLKYIDKLLVQTPNMKVRLESLYRLNNIEVVPNAVSLENMHSDDFKDFKLPNRIRLLYLTHYYPHKNIEIFLPLAKTIKQLKLPYILVTTLDAHQHIGAKSFLEAIENEGLKDIIHNVGAVSMRWVPSLYRQCNGLLMPTLLESFSGTYVEAMYHRIPIFTSDIDFATGVCQNGAIYFDPFRVESIILALNKVFDDDSFKNSLIEEASCVLNTLPNWNQTFKMYNDSIEDCLSKP